MTDPIWNDKSFQSQSSASIIGSRWFTVSLAVLAGIIGVTILYYLFYPSNQTNDNLYVIDADEKPFKEKPENPGGVRFPHQDKAVYENLLGDKPSETQVIVQDNVEKPLEIIERSPVKEDFDFVEEPPVVSPTKKVEEITPVIERVVVEEPIVIRDSKPFPEKKKDLKEKKPAPLKAAMSKGNYKVQLAALPSKARVENEWRVLRRRHKNLLGTAQMNIEKASIPGKGTLYRLQIGAYSTKEEAMTFCDQLKAVGISCFVAK